MKWYVKLAMGMFMIPMLCNAMVEVTDETGFNAALQQSENVIVDVYSERCGACKMLEPVYTKLDRDYGNVYKFIKVKYSPKNNDLLNRLNVRAFPTIIFFKKGNEVGRMIGYQEENAILAEAKKDFR